MNAVSSVIYDKMSSSKYGGLPEHSSKKYFTCGLRRRNVKIFRAKGKQVLCLLCTLFVIASVFACIGSIPVNAETNTAGHWIETNATGNLIPTLAGDSLVSQGWCTSNSNQTNPNGFWEDGVFKNRANSTEDDLGNKEYQGGVYYTIDLSDADRVKADLGQLTLTASSTNWFQASAHHYISVRAEFYNASMAINLSLAVVVIALTCVIVVLLVKMKKKRG